MSSVPIELIDDPRYLGGIYQEMETGFENANYTDPLTDFQADLVQAHQGYFVDRQDPNGSIWPALAPSTVKRKKHDRPLIDTQRLSRSLFDVNHPDHVGEINERFLVYGTDVEYGIFHQRGAGRIPQRAFVGMNEPLVGNVANRVADQAVDSLKAKV